MQERLLHQSNHVTYTRQKCPSNVWYKNLNPLTNSRIFNDYECPAVSRGSKNPWMSPRIDYGYNTNTILEACPSRPRKKNMTSSHRLSKNLEGCKQKTRTPMLFTFSYTDFRTITIITGCLICQQSIL
ncbi:hypothetical protein SK128_020495 [Halocaridina rubra]|uniref:Uncharacterized protein n=1 Tax=Halocaridina rubra TaxID=373956 RepID=A0AAN9AGH9_HALRR